MRTEALASALAAALAAASFAPVTLAQSPATSKTQPTGLMPVEPIRSTPRPRAQSQSAQQAAQRPSSTTATLRWRPSPRVTTTETAAADAQGQSSRPATDDTIADRRATPVAYFQDPSESARPETFGSPAGDGALPPRTAQKSAADPFLDPFNDGRAAGPIGQPSGDRPLVPAGRARPSLRPLQPVAQQQQQDADGADSPDAPLEADTHEDVQEAPTPQDSNPFPRRGEGVPSASDRERRDRERRDGQLPARETPEENLRERNARAPRYDRSAGQREEPSCDELRERIAARTIRKVSLDISPPFRPDVLAQDEYEMLKEEFIESQATRQWRSLEGELLGRGRLVDMAFENAIIESDDGQIMELSLAELSEPDLAYVTEAWGLPRECQLPQVAFQPREWLPIKMTWKASELCHKPLYFEEVNLERYGHTAGPFAQPVVSTAHFFFNIAVLPYKMGIHPPNECQYALGYYRPGNCAPWIIPPVPLSLRGALAETAVVGGMIGLIP